MEKTGKTILVVDDEEPLRVALCEELKYNGFSVLEAKDGEEGLSLARKNHPDLIMLDIVMPNMDGKKMTLELQKDDWGRKVPIIFLTNVSDPAEMTDAIRSAIGNATVFDYLIKSEWEMKEVIEKVKKKLRIKTP